MKKVLITGGPTNEYIDEVMKITNMSSGKVAIEMVNEFLAGGYEVTLLLTKGIKCDVESSRLKLVRFETTEELFKAIKEEAKIGGYDVVIHSAAVADYKPEFSFRLEDLAKELEDKIASWQNEFSKVHANQILEVLKNPDCKVDNSSKISSVEPNLTVKLGLTPKIIASLRELFPNAYICGFKLLENVPEEELIDAAMKQIVKCNTNLVFANDLAELRRGRTERLVITPGGYNGIKVHGATGIYNLIKIALDM